MAHLGTVFFRGQSGARYQFEAWPLGTRFKSLSAVCLFTKRSFRNHNFTGTASHECVHIGQTDDLAALSYDPHYVAGSDCICIHVLKNSEQRLAVERDLAESLGRWQVSSFQVDLGRRQSAVGQNAAPYGRSVAVGPARSI